MNRELTTLPPYLFMWLVTVDHEPMEGWAPEPPAAELRCDAGLVSRLAHLARPLAGTSRRFIEGCPVIHHPSGTPIAVAEGSSWIAVRSDLPTGALENSGSHVPSLSECGWAELDPWAPDTAFAQAIHLLRAHVARAYAMAEAGA